MPEVWLSHRMEHVRRRPDGMDATIVAVPASAAGELGGWLTALPPAEQGIETSLPNLPPLAPADAVPGDGERRYLLSISASARRTVRILLRPAGENAADDPRWLGIVEAVPEPSTVDVHLEQSTVLIDTEGVQVRLGVQPFRIEVRDTESGATVLRTAERLRQATGLPLCPAVLITDRRATLHLELADEWVTGLGEQFGRFPHNGNRLELRCTDALGTATGFAYKPVPVWHCGRAGESGYTALLNTGTTVVADVEHTRPGALAMTVGDEIVDLHLVLGSEPKQRLSTYTAITGRARVPPPWAFGYWLGRCRYHDSAEMLAVARAARANDVPLDVLHCDPNWLVTDRLNCDFIWNEQRFGDRTRFVSDLRDEGVRLSLWELPYLDPASPRYAEAERGGHLVRDERGEVAPVTGTPSPDGRPRALVDLASPSTAAWWQNMHEPFLDDGVAVFKTDFGEGLPDDAVLGDGTPPRHAHNLYPLRYNAAVAEVIGRRTGRPALVWGRSGWAGSQRHPAQWAGDAESSVAGMRATVRAGLSYALSAPGLWGHDVGGFFGAGLSPGLYVRWTQLGALSPLMRAHGLTAREPWAFDERTLAIAADWIRLRYSLLPYLWQVAHEAAEHGWPMMRPLGLEFPDDPVAATVDDAFLLGADLLVVPVFDDDSAPVRRRHYLPPGHWTELTGGETVCGPGFRTVDVPPEAMPVLVRHRAGGTALPRVDVAGARNTDDLLDRPWQLHTYGGSPASAEFTGFDRSRTGVRVDGDTVTASGTQPFTPEILRRA